MPLRSGKEFDKNVAIFAADESVDMRYLKKLMGPLNFGGFNIFQTTFEIS